MRLQAGTQQPTVTFYMIEPKSGVVPKWAPKVYQTDDQGQSSVEAMAGHLPQSVGQENRGDRRKWRVERRGQWKFREALRQGPQETTCSSASTPRASSRRSSSSTDMASTREVVYQYDFDMDGADDYLARQKYTGAMSVI